MPKDTTTNAESTALAPRSSNGAINHVKELIMSVPQLDTDPTERMVEYILNTPPEEWSALWDKLPNVKDNAGRRFRLHDFRFRESDFEGELGVYLICDVTWLDSGEKGLLSCSSQISMVQMLTLRRDGKLPADLEIVAKDKPTKAGFRPIHLHYLDTAQVAAGDPTKVVSEQ